MDIKNANGKVLDENQSTKEADFRKKVSSTVDHLQATTELIAKIMTSIDPFARDTLTIEKRV